MTIIISIILKSNFTKERRMYEHVRTYFIYRGPWVIDCLTYSRMFKLIPLVQYDYYFIAHTFYLGGR